MHLSVVTGPHARHFYAQKELKEVERDKASGVTIKIVGSSLQKLIGYVQGVCCD